ncbi:MAG TPA: polysaccharide deacetylase family protein [Pilimelia sp.]|nr:polysaccharide deacetylase family protein [Pilimelia sp.]
MKSLTAEGSSTFRTRWGTRLADSHLRRRLRARPAMQGRLLAPAGIFRRLPTTAGLYFPFYHDIPAHHAREFRDHLLTFRRLGSFVTWEESVAILTGRRSLPAPTFCLSFDDCHRSWLDVALPVLRCLDIPATFFVITGTVGQRGELTWNDCRELAAAGMGIGSHTRSHQRLAALDDSAAILEIRDSKAEIEDQIGRPVLDFAAPYGWPDRDYLARDVELARRAGYRSFATTARAVMRPGDTPWAIRRQGLHPAWPMWAVRTRLHE